MEPADLQGLLAVQDMDTRADQLKHRRSHLPEREAVAEIDRNVAALESDLAAVAAQREAAVGRQSELESELAATEERAATVNRRLYSGEVSASRELQAMAADVDVLKARSSELEDAILGVLEEIEPLDARLGELSASIGSLQEKRVASAGALEEAEGALDSEMAQVEAERSRAAGSVDPALLATYERLRQKLGGVGVARLSGGRCEGCHLSLPATELDRIRRLPPGELVTCDQCGRILVP